MMKNLVTKIFQRLPNVQLLDDSITKNLPNDDNNPQFVQQKSILAILDSANFIKLCVLLAIFYTLIGVSMQSPYLSDFRHLFEIVIETFVSSLFIIIAIVIFLRWYMKKNENKILTSKQLYFSIMGYMLLIIPTMSLLSRGLIFVFFHIKLTWLQLFTEAIANTLMVVLMLYIILSYLNHQILSIQEIHSRYHQKLRDENEQLKARTAPHFFFNMLNTIQSLVETDPDESIVLLGHISTLYRASFAETKEVSMLDEMEICEHYLSIEKYRFHDRLIITWDIPDEEILYDMSVPSLMLQTTIEKMILYVVEMTADTIYIYIQIRWENDWVNVQCTANIPTNTYLQITDELDERLSYNKQIEVLREYYGQEANITGYYDAEKIVTSIYYPLKDIAC